MIRTTLRTLVNGEPYPLDEPRTVDDLVAKGAVRKNEKTRSSRPAPS